MKLLNTFYDDAETKEFYAIIGNSSKLNVIESSAHLTKSWSWEPKINLSLSVFEGSAFSFAFSAWSLHLFFTLFKYAYPMDVLDDWKERATQKS